MLSVNERRVVASGVKENVRADGRQRLQFRGFTLETGVLPQAAGSCRVQVDDLHGRGRTEVLVGIKVEVGNIVVDSDAAAAGAAEGASGEPDAPANAGRVERTLNAAFNRGRVECHVECAPAAAPAGRRAADVEAEYAALLTRLLNGAQGGIDLAKLVIADAQLCWVVYVDAMILAHGGHPLDAVLLGCYAALQDARIPKATLVSLDTGEVDFEIDDDPDAATPVPGAAAVPVGVTLCRIGGDFCVDPTVPEAACASAQVLVAANHHGRVCLVHKLSGGAIPTGEIADMVRAGRVLGVALVRKLVEFLAQQREQRDGTSASLFV